MSLRASLAGITVVSFEQAVAAPFATRHLADLGARVIKVERPDGGDFARQYDRRVHGQSSYFVWLNRGKESIALDLKNPEDLGLARRLLDRADVVVQNLAPGALGRLGLDLGALREARPEVVTCSISGYGPGGPESARKAYDLIIQADSGLLDVTGEGAQRNKVGISIADIATGMYAFSGILAALLQRELVGHGSHVEIAMIDSMTEWMQQPFYYVGEGSGAYTRTGPHHASIAPYGPFPSMDGEIFLAVQNDREWRLLCQSVLSRPELAEDPRFVHNPERVANSDILRDIIAGTLSTLPLSQVRRMLDDAGIANAAVRAVGDIAQHEQLAARQRWGLIDLSGQAVPALLPVLADDGDISWLRPVPALGEHTDDVRDEFGTTRYE